MSEDLILTPEEVEKRRRRVIITEEEITPAVIEDNNEKSTEKYFNRGGKVSISYETCGRFDIPETLYFRDYTVEEVNNLTLSRGENILENLVSILENAKNEDANCSVGDMLPEEFMETLVGVKKQFNTNIHVHPWVCECQEGLEEKEVKVNEENIDLNNIQYISILEADKKMQGIYLEKLNKVDDSVFREYLLKKYANAPLEDLDSYTREMEANRIQIKEPVYFINKVDGLVYGFRFPRIKDIIKAQKIADSKFNGQIKLIQNRRETGTSLAEIKEKKEQEINVLKESKGKYIMLCARGLSLLSIGDRVINVDSEKVEIYKNLPRSFLLEIMDFFNQIEFGIQDEKELVCNLCGKSSKRSLQREFQFMELLPLDSDSKRNSRQSAGLNVYFGI